ncbi:MAG: Mur ligase family protein [Hyphomicrobiaceae bacterium]
MLQATQFELRRLNARLKRRRSKATFIAVTGSSAKSTTTALIAHILSGVEETHVQAVKNNLGDSIDTLSSGSPHRGYSVWEMNGGRPGCVRSMSQLLKPTIGLVTLVELEHKSAYGSRDAIQIEKQALIESLPDHGLALLNHDDVRVASMAAHTNARVKTFGKGGGDYLVSKVRAEEPGQLTLSVSHKQETCELKSRFTGAHQSLPVVAAYACARELGVPIAICQERIASFKPIFGRCSVHVIENGPTFIADTGKAPYHSIYLAIQMMAEFKAPRKRIVVGQISDTRGNPNPKYRDIYRASRDAADQVIFIGEHSHRSKATAVEIAEGRFLQIHNIEDLARYLRETAVSGEIILLKSSSILHLERTVLSFLSDVRCWKERCSIKYQCVECGLYGQSIERHSKNAQRISWELDEVRDPVQRQHIARG